jgi:hypothetical protein
MHSFRQVDWRVKLIPLCSNLQANVTFSTDGFLLHSASDDAAKQAERRQQADEAAAAAAEEQERLEARCSMQRPVIAALQMSA